MNQQEEKKEFWAIVSLMGHQQLAGFLDEYTMGGCNFLRLTVPETPKQPKWARLFKDNSTYPINPWHQKNISETVINDELVNPHVGYLYGKPTCACSQSTSYLWHF